LDLLTDILREAGLHRRLMDLRRLTSARALQFPCDKSIGLHVVAQGTVHLHAPTLPGPLALQSGDIAVMARGCHHLLSLHADPDAVPIEPIRAVPDTASPSAAGPHGAPDAPARADARSAPPGPPEPKDPAQPPAEAAVVSGAYQLWNTPLHPLFNEMPAWFVLRADEVPRLGPLALAVGLLDDEMRHGGLGAETIVHGLLDVVFTYLLRELVDRLGQDGAGWGQAVRDPEVRRAVTLMHADSAHPWTLTELARRAGLSRTALAGRFRAAMGDTPLNYLRGLRMQKAMRLLGETDHHLEAVALQVGYQDAFGFSKVFKRTVGVSPRDFRRRELESRQDPWRFKAG